MEQPGKCHGTNRRHGDLQLLRVGRERQCPIWLIVVQSHPQPGAHSPTNTGSTKPSAPTSIAATHSGNGLKVSWTAPTNHGSAAITSYTVTVRNAAGHVVGTCVSHTLTCNVAGLAAGACRVSVSATSSAGSSAASSAAVVHIAPTVLSSSNFYFATGAWSIAGHDQSELMVLAAHIAASHATKVTLTGFTSAVGTAAVNKAIGLNRAREVAQYLETYLAKLGDHKVTVRIVNGAGTNYVAPPTSSVNCRATVTVWS